MRSQPPQNTKGPPPSSGQRGELEVTLVHYSPRNKDEPSLLSQRRGDTLRRPWWYRPSPFSRRNEYTGGDYGLPLTGEMITYHHFHELEIKQIFHGEVNGDSHKQQDRGVVRGGCVISIFSFITHRSNGGSTLFTESEGEPEGTMVGPRYVVGLFTLSDSSDELVTTTLTLDL